MPECGGLLPGGAVAADLPRPHGRPGRPGRGEPEEGTALTRVGVITQARMTSTRLPGKVLLRAGGRTMLEHQLRRLGVVGVPIIVATTVNRSDDAIVEAAEELGAPVFRGSEDDVLSRFDGAAEAFGLDAVVRVTSDCPLIDGEVVRRGIDDFLERDDDAYVSNTLERTFPRGFDFEVFSAAALHDAAAHATDPADREHVTPYLNKNRSGRVSLFTITQEVDASRYRVTLDTAEDFSLIRALIEDHGASDLSAAEIVSVLDSHPELVELNASVEQKKVG
ncbi:cytidylyltransferase domain-containing protein [Microbacterium sp. NPDC057650]|uniref:cytidylyltransferase domain-containing protein n=1 Tax=unclassified Microbacterium TaxID=2609290 RepID=UPI00366F7FC3